MCVMLCYVMLCYVSGGCGCLMFMAACACLLFTPNTFSAPDPSSPLYQRQTTKETTTTDKLANRQTNIRQTKHTIHTSDSKSTATSAPCKLDPDVTLANARADICRRHFANPIAARNSVPNIWPRFLSVALSPRDPRRRRRQRRRRQRL